MDSINSISNLAKARPLEGAGVSDLLPKDSVEKSQSVETAVPLNFQALRTRQIPEKTTHFGEYSKANAVKTVFNGIGMAFKAGPLYGRIQENLAELVNEGGQKK